MKLFYYHKIAIFETSCFNGNKNIRKKHINFLFFCSISMYHIYYILTFHLLMLVEKYICLCTKLQTISQLLQWYQINHLQSKEQEKYLLLVTQNRKILKAQWLRKYQQ